MSLATWPRRMANTASYTKPSYRRAGIALETLAQVLPKVCAEGAVEQLKYMPVGGGEFVEAQAIALDRVTGEMRNFAFYLDTERQAIVARPVSDRLGFSDPLQVDLSAKSLRLANYETRRKLRVLARELRHAATHW